MMLSFSVTAPVCASRRPFDARARIQRHRGQGENRADERGGAAERGRATDLPKDVAGLRPAFEHDRRAGSRCQGRTGLEDEDGAGVTAGVQRDGTCQLHGRGRLVHAWTQGRATDVPARDRGKGRLARRHAERRCRRRLSGERGRVSGAGRAVDETRGKPVIDVPGERPMLPVMTVLPVFVIVVPATTAYGVAEPRLIAVAAANAGLPAKPTKVIMLMNPTVSAFVLGDEVRNLAERSAE